MYLTMTVAFAVDEVDALLEGGAQRPHFAGEAIEKAPKLFMLTGPGMLVDVQKAVSDKVSGSVTN